MVRRYLLVLDMDLLAADERLGLEPISLNWRTARFMRCPAAAPMS